MGIRSGSRYFLKFWKITDSIWETIQDRDSYNGRLTENRVLINGSNTNDPE